MTGDISRQLKSVTRGMMLWVNMLDEFWGQVAGRARSAGFYPLPTLAPFNACWPVASKDRGSGLLGAK